MPSHCSLEHGLMVTLLALKVLSPTQCLLPTRHELFATSSPIGLVTLAPIPTWQKCPHCFATCFYHLAFKRVLNCSSVMSRATEILWFQASNTSFWWRVPKYRWFPSADPFTDSSQGGKSIIGASGGRAPRVLFPEEILITPPTTQPSVGADKKLCS